VITVGELFLARRFGYLITKPVFLTLNLLAMLPFSTSTDLCPLTLAALARKACP